MSPNSRIRSAVLLASALFMAGCSSTYKTTIPASTPPELDRAVHKTARTLKLILQSDNDLIDSGNVAGNYWLRHQGISTQNNTSFNCNLLWRRDSARYGFKIRSTSWTLGGDSRAIARFVPLCIKQQLELDRGARAPSVNPPKSMAGFMARNMVSTSWGVHYLIKNNPLISNKTAPLVYLQSGIFGDFIVAGFAGNFALNPTSANGKSALYALSFSLVTRLMAFLYYADLKDYETIRPSPYNLREIADEY